MQQTLFAVPHLAILTLWIIGSLAAMGYTVWRHGIGSDVIGMMPVIVVSGAVVLFVLPLLEDAQRGLPIRGYGVMMLLGVVGGVMLAVIRAPAARIDSEMVFSLAFWMFAAGILGARAFHVIEYWDVSYRQSTWTATLGAIINIPKGGLVVYGAFVAVTLMLPLFIWRNKLPGLALCDLIAPSMLLGLALGRVGCLLNGCCYGGLCDYPWAVRFPPKSPVYEDQQSVGLLQGIRLGENAQGHVIVREIVAPAPREAGLRVGDRIVAINKRRLDAPPETREPESQEAMPGKPGPIDELAVARSSLVFAKDAALTVETLDGHIVHWSAGALPARSLPVHPTQIYSSIDALILCVLLLVYYPFRRHDGEVFALLLTIYPISRFLTEMIRVDEAAQFNTGLSISQLVSIGVWIGAAALWIYLLRQPKGRLWANTGPT